MTWFTIRGESAAYHCLQGEVFALLAMGSCGRTVLVDDVLHESPSVPARARCSACVKAMSSKRSEAA